MAFSIDARSGDVIAAPSDTERGRGRNGLGGDLRAEKLAQGRVHVLLVRDDDRDEAFILDRLERVHQCTARPNTPFPDLSVAEDVGDFEELVAQLDTAAIIDISPVIAVGEVEGIDVPRIRVEALLDDVERELIGRGDLGAATLAQLEEGLLIDL